MAAETPFSKFLVRLEGQLNYYDAKAKINQGNFYRCSIMSFSMSALIPIIALLPAYDSIWPRVVVAILGGGITVITGLLGIKKYQELRLKYRATWNALMRERVFYENRIAPYDKDTLNEVFIINCESIMSGENESWIQTVKSYKSSSPKGL